MKCLEGKSYSGPDSCLERRFEDVISRQNSARCDDGYRLTWRSGELCDHKLPFEFWVYMKAEGTANDPDASHVRNECLKARNIGMVELITPEAS